MPDTTQRVLLVTVLIEKKFPDILAKEFWYSKHSICCPFSRHLHVDNPHQCHWHCYFVKINTMQDSWSFQFQLKMTESSVH